MASNLPRKVLIFGATGVIGKFIIQEIVNAKSSFDKIGLFTSPETASNKRDEINGWEENGVDINVGDVNLEDDVKKAYEGHTSPSQGSSQVTLCKLYSQSQATTLSSQHSAAMPS